MKKLLVLVMGMFITLTSFSQDTIRIKNNVFEVLYSQKLEQPLWIKYRSTNRPTNVNRGTMDFYTEKGIKTSDGEDYKTNVYDKGHGAPAATFSDNMENLKQTFSYLNCIMQNQYLNRGEWRLLEEQIIPSHLQKHIYIEKQKKWRCFVFLNEKPKFEWEQLEMICEPKDHK